MASAGRILILPKGAYDSSTTYEMLDLVNHNGKSWLAKQTSIGIEPSEANAEYWQDMFSITAENAGAVQRTIWKWVNNAGDSLFSYIKSKLEEGYTCGMIQVETTNGALSDIPQSVASKVGGFFMCSFQRHYYGYVRATIWGDASTYEYSNWGVISEDSWATNWTERMCIGGYLPKSGGTLTGDVTIEKDIPKSELKVSDELLTVLCKNATTEFNAGTEITDVSGNVRTVLTLKEGSLQLFKYVDNVLAGSVVIAEIT